MIEAAVAPAAGLGTPALPIEKVAIIGAGVAGRKFALACTRAGFYVVLEDVMPANLRHAEGDFADPASSDLPARFALASTVEDAVRDADIAIDFVPDELESKLEIFSMIDRMAPPRTILCTPSETLSITDLASCTYRGDRCVALRGGLFGVANGAGGGLRVLHASGVSTSVLLAVGKFLERLGASVTAELDPDEPALLKNMSGARR